VCGTSLTGAAGRARQLGPGGVQVVELNRAIASAEFRGAEAGLQILDRRDLLLLGLGQLGPRVAVVAVLEQQHVLHLSSSCSGLLTS
jgi:hypothetical protein